MAPRSVISLELGSLIHIPVLPCYFRLGTQHLYHMPIFGELTTRKLISFIYHFYPLKIYGTT